ncbi:MAG: hypothetical protein P4L49_05000 [Desulfosporosinus sp.]|nr:hypothetical protein [Desulfosporosinus sp.]
MDEGLEEIRAISRVWPVRKLIFARPRRGKRELAYRFNQPHKAKKPPKTNLEAKKTPDGSMTDAETVANSNDYVADLKKRSVFDRAIIIGD